MPIRHTLMENRPAPMPSRAERERNFRRHWQFRHARDQRRHLDRTLARQAFCSLCYFVHGRRPRQIDRWERWSERALVRSTPEIRARIRREIAEAFASALATRGAAHRPTDQDTIR